MKLDMSASAVSARLQHMSRLSEGLTPQALVEAKIDMSPEAITRRLREVSELRELCLKLRAAWHGEQS